LDDGRGALAEGLAVGLEFIPRRIEITDTLGGTLDDRCLRRSAVSMQ